MIPWALKKREGLRAQEIRLKGFIRWRLRGAGAMGAEEF